MILEWIGTSLIVQIILYLLLDKVRYVRGIIVIALLALHFYFLPQWFLLAAESPAEGESYRCGIVSVSIYLISWIFGCGLTLIVHVGYILVSTSRQVHKKQKP